MNIDRELVEELCAKYYLSIGDLISDFTEALRRDDVETHAKNGGNLECIGRVGVTEWHVLSAKEMNRIGRDLNWEDYNFRIKEETLSERRDYLIENLGDLVYPNPLELENLAFLKDLDL